MKKIILFFCAIMCVLFADAQQNNTPYLDSLKKEFVKVWPKNRTINIVFHGHSVPAGYWHNHEVHTLESYPYLVLKSLKEKYPYAVINIIITAIGGENSIKGQTRFDQDVLIHKPDIIFIDYALNDVNQDLPKTKEAWSKMIKKALEQHIKVILVTPSPDQRIDILSPDNKLEQQAIQIRKLAQEYHVGLADPYKQFKNIAEEKKSIVEVMSHVNHPNLKGHTIIANEILKLF